MKRAGWLLILSGCAIHPEGEDEERARAAAAYPDVEIPALAPGASLEERQREADSLLQTHIRVAVGPARIRMNDDRLLDGRRAVYGGSAH